MTGMCRHVRSVCLWAEPKLFIIHCYFLYALLLKPGFSRIDVCYCLTKIHFEKGGVLNFIHSNFASSHLLIVD